MPNKAKDTRWTIECDPGLQGLGDEAFSMGRFKVVTRNHPTCPKCGSKLIRAPYVIVCESVTCDFDARRPQ